MKICKICGYGAGVCMQLAIFPMRLNLLPDGILPLRIFEPRYQRMIAEMGQREFGLCLLGKSIDSGATPLLTVGTRVEVIDFDLMPDQTLSVTVRGIDRFRIQKIVAEPDGLMGAEAVCREPTLRLVLSAAEMVGYLLGRTALAGGITS
jgi:Lon protease-like protein